MILTGYHRGMTRFVKRVAKEMEALQRYGETYYRIEEIQEFIEQCSRNDEIIFSVEFFRIFDDKVIPYGALQSIDSTKLYDEKKSKKEYVSICNNFIKTCVDRCIKDLKNLYFNPTIAS